MDSTIFLARIMGLYALVEGASMLVKRRMLLGVFSEMAKSRALSYIVGVCIVIIGLLLVLGHNTFESVLAGAITVALSFKAGQEQGLYMMVGIALILFSALLLAIETRIYDRIWDTCPPLQALEKWWDSIKDKQ